jgi:hypothetical protein
VLEQISLDDGDKIKWIIDFEQAIDEKKFKGLPPYDADDNKFKHLAMLKEKIYTKNGLYFLKNNNNNSSF